VKLEESDRRAERMGLNERGVKFKKSIRRVDKKERKRAKYTDEWRD